MVLALSSTQLTSPATAIGKIKYFPVELSCSNMLPSSPHDVYFEGVQVNAFCKPFGGNLGDPIISNEMGQLHILFLMSVQYNQQYLVSHTTQDNLVSMKKTLEFRDSTGQSSVSYIPMMIKAG